MTAPTRKVIEKAGCRLVQHHADESGGVRICVRGCLDERSGRLLLEATDAAATQGGVRVRVDLRSVTSFTDAGVEAASACCRVAAGLPRGVSFLVAAGDSRRALLAILDRS